MFSPYPMGAPKMGLPLLESITSINIRKIVFVMYLEGYGWDPAFWSPLDKVLSNLVDRLRTSGYEHTLELGFQLKPEFAGVYPTIGLDAYFPHFLEKGRVNLLDKSGRRFYCSDG